MGSTEIDTFLEAEFKKLVPYKPLTGPEVAAIKLAFKRYLRKKLNQPLTYEGHQKYLLLKELIKEVSL